MPRIHWHLPPLQRTLLRRSVTHLWVKFAISLYRSTDSSRKGTTGNPKGAVITQGALAVSTYGCLAGFDIPATEAVTLLSYLPLAHIYEVT